MLTHAFKYSIDSVSHSLSLARARDPLFLHLAKHAHAGCDQFQVDILISEDIYKMLSPRVQSLCRRLDRVTVKVICPFLCRYLRLHFALISHTANPPICRSILISFPFNFERVVSIFSVPPSSFSPDVPSLHFHPFLQGSEQPMSLYTYDVPPCEAKTCE